MTASNHSVSRRAALRLAAFSFAAASTAALANQFDLKELKEDVEELKYDEEVTDIGPDAAEKNVTRTKKTAEVPKFRTEEAELLKKEDAAYDAMVEKELEEDARLKAQFSQK